MAFVLKSKQHQFGENTASIEVFNWEDVAEKARAYLASIREQADALLKQAQQESEKLRIQAEQQGRELGQNDIAQQADRLANKLANERVAQASQSLQALATELEQATHQWLRQWQHETVPLAVSIAERLVHRQIEIDPTIILDWLNESIRLVQTDHRLDLRMNPADIERLGSSLTDFIEQQKNRMTIQLSSDPSIEKHGIVLQTSESTINQQITTQLERLREELQ
jgi:flagellar biosynthesis/type III secretory pathway protein FliH